jgi:hypothetical protein
MLGAGNTAACFLPRRVPGLVTPVWCFAYGVFDKIVFGFVALFNDCLDQVNVFITRASCAHDSMALSCAHGFKCGYIDTDNPDHGVPSHGYLDQCCSTHHSRLPRHWHTGYHLA